MLFDEFSAKDDFYLGAASILENVCEDLKKINEAMTPLYRLQGKIPIGDRDNDYFSDFIYSSCTVKDHLVETAKNLYDHLSKWWLKNAPHDMPGRKIFDFWMESRGFSKVRESSRGAYVFQGLQLNAEK